MGQKNPKDKDVADTPEPDKTGGGGDSGRPAGGNGSWQKIEALREKAALKASLADVWDEDFDLPEEILDELDHKAEFFTRQADEEPIPDDEDEIDDYFDDEDDT